MGLSSSLSGTGGTADLADGNGTGTLVTVYVMENGDKFFDRRAVVAQNPSGKFTSTHVGHITGGTGKFAGMQGIVRASVNFDIKTSVTETQIDIEYWIAK
jgi:hypothetical protein